MAIEERTATLTPEKRVRILIETMSLLKELHKKEWIKDLEIEIKRYPKGVLKKVKKERKADLKEVQLEIVFKNPIEKKIVELSMILQSYELAIKYLYQLDKKYLAETLEEELAKLKAEFK